MDSNNKNINFSKLFEHHYNVELLYCPTAASAVINLQSKQLKPPTKILIHIGTNDLDVMSPVAAAKNILDLAENLEREYKCRVVISLALIRGDHLNNKVRAFNQLIKDTRYPHINHENITSEYLHDSKHLDRYTKPGQHLSGSQVFAGDIYQAITGRRPAQETLRISKQWPRKRTSHRNSIPMLESMV